METTPLPVPLAERVEFGSPEWIATARAYLEPRAAERADSLRGVRLAICEVYSDPPPHLGFDGAAAFHIVIDDGQVTVGIGEIDDVDLKVRADYNKAHAVVTSVYETNPKRRARLLGELAHRHGDVFEMKGALDETSPAYAVISGLHDHAARRTIANPDIDHRLHHLGLESALAELNERGYTILEGAFSPRLADDLKAVLRDLIAEGPPPHLTAAQLLSRGELFEEIAVHPWVLTLAEKLAGAGCVLGQSLAFTKAKGVDTHQLHSDYALVPEPFPEQCLNVTSIWALDDFTETSGPTVVVPGSHKRNCHPTAEATIADAVKIIMPKGSVALWHGATWHGAAIREDDGDRLSLHNSYFRYFMRSFDSYLDIDPTVLERNSPTVTTLCGLDDPFEKNSFKGPNRERLNYARRNYSSIGD